VAVTAAFGAAALAGFGVGANLHAHGARSSVAAASAVVPSAPVPAPGGTGATSPASSTGTGVSAAQAALATQVDVGLVDINTVLGYQRATGAGTGMILTPSGEILTNNHVIDGATSISVTLVSTEKTYIAAVVGTDPTQDIAVLQLKGVSGLEPIPTADSPAVAIGDSVMAIGNAGGVGGTPAVVTGSVQALDQTITASDETGANAETLSGLIQLNAPIQPGDSGGPLVNSAGRVIGIDTAASTGMRFSTSGTVGFAIPIDQALNIASQIESGHATTTVHIGLPGFLGVAIDPGSSAAGAVVTGVESGSPAAKAGLAAGDTITSIDGRPVASAPTLTAVTAGHHVGNRVTLSWVISQA
jgi:S1-C subfamily serine protease